jgi:hypothetical protein
VLIVYTTGRWISKKQNERNDKMTNANPILHMICGKCGNRNELSFEINPKGACSFEGVEFPAVFVICGNCTTLSDLSETIQENNSEGA